MSEMVERMARLLCEQYGGDPDALASEPHDSWDGPLWTVFVPEARAVIEAMREPGQSVLSAGEDAWCRHNHGSPYSNEIADIWSAMIDAALKDDTNE